ncbi:sodium/glutamate symporter, partial [Candidatus Riflebacteria bacterium]
MSISLDLMQTYGMAVIVLFIGYFFNNRITILKKYNIPAPVVGGIVFALLTSFLFTMFNLQFKFDMSLKNPLMLTFFTTVGLGASYKLLLRGGPRVILFLILAAIYLVIQNGVGILIALNTDLNPLLGLIGGSITLSGGHGTGAAYAGLFAKQQNLQAALELAMACATFGLVLGGLIGGPVAKRLITVYNLKPEGDPKKFTESVTYDPEDVDRVTPLSVMETMLLISICIIPGNLIFNYFQSIDIAVPSFICSLLIGIIIANFCEMTGIYEIKEESVDLCGTIGLSIFLCMALMSLRLWELANLAGPMLLILVVQTLILALFCYFITFRVMGKNYDAAIIAGGHCGFGMGATPTAVANMEALTSKYGPSPEAFLIVPMVGAFFIDIANTAVLRGFLAFLPIF